MFGHFKGIKGKVTSICKKILTVLHATHQMFQQEVQVQNVASGEEVEIMRREPFQSLAEGSHCQNLCTTSRSGASEILQKFSSCEMGVNI